MPEEFGHFARTWLQECRARQQITPTKAETLVARRETVNSISQSRETRVGRDTSGNWETPSGEATRLSILFMVESGTMVSSRLHLRT